MGPGVSRGGGELAPAMVGGHPVLCLLAGYAQDHLHDQRNRIAE